MKSKFEDRPAPPRGRLLHHYFIISVLLVAGGLMSSGILEVYFRVHERRAHLAQLQKETATVAAVRIERFVQDIETVMTATAKGFEIGPENASWGYKFELKRLLHLVPAITEAAAIDANGIEQTRLSRLLAVPVANKQNLSDSTPFLEARRGRTYLGPVYLARGSEPYLTMALPIEEYRGRIIGVLQAEVNLKYVLDVVSSVKPGQAGYAYVVSRSGDLVAHPDITRVLQGRKLSHLSQVRAAFQPQPEQEALKLTIVPNMEGEKVISSFALIPRLDWAVFIESPAAEAYEALYGSVLRTASLLLIGLGVALFASFFVARRVLRPLRALRQGVDRIGKGDLSFRVELQTGDEIQTLAQEFNKMAGALKESYTRLEEKVAERTWALGRANERLLDLDKLKSDFVSNVSHELRTPLTAIKGSIDNMLDGLTGPLNEKQRRYLMRVKSNADRLGRFVNDVLDLSKIEAGKLEIRPSRLSVVEWATEVTDNLRSLADGRQIRLDVVYSESNVVVRGDRDKLAQVLTNVVGNAIKFSPIEGQVVLHIRRTGSEFVEISVADNGPGISAERIDKVFDKFHQVDLANGKKPEGSGLGLAISKAIVELHGGKIWLQSAANVGTTIFFTLPVEPARTSADLMA